jgi:hypothetical protein
MLKEIPVRTLAEMVDNLKHMRAIRLDIYLIQNQGKQEKILAKKETLLFLPYRK